MKNLFIVVALIALIAGGGVFFIWSYARDAVDNQEIKSEPLRIGFVPWIGNGVYYVAQEKGFFAAEKVNVKFINVDDVATLRQILQTGEVDISYALTPESMPILNDAGVKIKVFAANDLSAGADGIIATKEIDSVEDLKGKKVAFEIGSPSHFLLSYLLDKKGLTTRDLKIVESIAPDAGAAFVAGKVDAAVTWEPWLSKAVERAGGHLLISSKDAPIIFDMPIMRADVAEARSKDIKAMLRAVFESQKWINAHKEEAASIIARYLKITPQEAMDQMQGVHWLSYEENKEKLTSGEYSIKNSIQIAGDLWLKLGLTKTKMHAEEIIDDSFIRDLYK
ncbi:MAG: ABC transporter, substrate-binding protein, aliphatic sulfonates family [Parcubacteria group bacterium Gr01-1014_33]|nr:MAG: ABC transporter, substrate-binding protein, aliphatic sulfonates family [Parcubacteria group bacterium Gr01-1014_33]